MNFKKLVSVLSFAVIFSTISLLTASCIDASAQEQVDREFLDGYNLQELEQQKDKIQFDGDSVNLLPGATCEIPIIVEEGNISYDYVSSDDDIASVIVKDGKGIVVAGEKEGDATITVRSSNNKIGYFIVHVSNVIAPSEDEEKTGVASNISDSELENSYPTEIKINGSTAAKKKLTIIEGQSIIINPTLYPEKSNGLWKIYWQYNRLTGDSVESPTRPGYFYFNIVDNSTKSTLGQTPEEQSEGFWKDGQKMGYKVEVFGVKAREPDQPLRKLICSTVAGVKAEIEIEVVASSNSSKANQSIIYPQIEIYGNYGGEIKMRGNESGFFTAKAYPNETGLTFNAESLNPSVFTVSSENFHSGQMVPVKPVAVGTGYVRVTMGLSTAVCKVIVEKEYILALGNMQFTVCIDNRKEGEDDYNYFYAVDGGGNIMGNEGTNVYPFQRVLPDGVESAVWGTYFPTSANAPFLIDDKEESLRCITDVFRTGSKGADIVGNQNESVTCYKGGHFKSEGFTVHRKFKQRDASSYKAQTGCMLYVGPTSEIGEGVDYDDRMRAASGKHTGVLGFAVHNKNSERDNPYFNKDFCKETQSSSTADTSTDPSPLYLVMDTGSEDIKSSATSGYIGVFDNIFIKRTSLITQYKTSSSSSITKVKTMIASGESVDLPAKIVEPIIPENTTKTNKDNKITITKRTYSFDKWVKYDIDSKTIGSESISSLSYDGSKIVIGIAKFTETKEETSVEAWDDE